MQSRRQISKVRAFTLIELILVMAVLLMAASLITPKLESFLGGRAADSEVRRFVALSRYGQNRAVSEGIPTVLWIDPKANTYGLRQETGYADNDDKAVQYTVNEGLSIDVDKSNGKATIGKSMGIHFLPEGTSDAATSIKGVSIREGNRPPIWIMRATNGWSYEAQYQNTAAH